MEDNMKKRVVPKSGYFPMVCCIFHASKYCLIGVYKTFINTIRSLACLQVLQYLCLPLTTPRETSPLLFTICSTLHSFIANAYRLHQYLSIYKCLSLGVLPLFSTTKYWLVLPFYGSQYLIPLEVTKWYVSLCFILEEMQYQHIKGAIYLCNFKTTLPSTLSNRIDIQLKLRVFQPSFH